VIALDVEKAISTTSSGISLVQQIDELLDTFRPYKPEVKRIRINYASQETEIKYLLNIPNNLKRSLKNSIEIPESKGFRVEEVWDMDRINPLKFEYKSDEGLWVFYVGDFPTSEKYMVSVKGHISTDFLNRIVDVKCAANPTRRENDDCYWIHAALKDVSILKKIWDELDIDRVNIDVRIGVERFFSSMMPKEITERMRLQKELLDAITEGRRNIEGLKSKYRYTSTKTTISPTELFELMQGLASAESFTNYIFVNSPFLLGSIEPERRLTSMLPNRVKVGVITDLNYDNPAAKGELIFKRDEYSQNVQKKIESLV
jgi:hypothetical protein